jgi:hypothetical protein
MIPTPEQAHALDLFQTGDRLVLEARAGAGKTSTLQLFAEDATRYQQRSVQYVAFNKSLVVEATPKFGRNAECSTAHSLAYQAIGRRYRHRIQDGKRMKGEHIAKILKVSPIDVTTPSGNRHLTAGFLAGHVMRAINEWCKSADPVPTWQHFPYIEHLDRMVFDTELRRWVPGRANSDAIAKALAPKLHVAWGDLCDRNGQLKFSHGHYLKMWQLDPKAIIPSTVILWDEIQDASDVMLDVILRQRHAQIVGVGDGEQQIYQWAGAENALAKIPDANHAWLTQSFRFGYRIAEVANQVLGWLDADPPVRGTGSILDTVGLITQPHALLCRSNSKALDAVLDAIDHDRRVALVGGADDFVRFAWAAQDLKEGRRTDHPELACFATWYEVLDYVDTDPAGHELKLWVDLFARWAPSLITAMLHQLVDEDQAELVVSTAHKSKGREWRTVQLASDFPDEPAELAPTIETEELRLLYVAVTRARERLDTTNVLMFNPNSQPAEVPYVV